MSYVSYVSYATPPSCVEDDIKNISLIFNMTTVYDETPVFLFDLYRKAFELIHNIDLSQDQYKHCLVIALDDTKPYDVSPANLILCC